MKLTDTLNSPPVEPVAAEQAVRKRWMREPTIGPSSNAKTSARLNYSAAKWERLPSVAGFGDYGSIGSSINNAIPTHTYGV